MSRAENRLIFGLLLALSATFASCSNSKPGDDGDAPDTGSVDGDSGPSDSSGTGGEDGGTGGSGVLPIPGCELGYKELPDGFDGVNVERVCVPDTLLDKTASRAAFEANVYPLLLENCAKCHSSSGEGQAPLHSDVDAALAHEYALTRVNFKNPRDSKLVVRLEIDRHNCFGGGCQAAGATMLEAVTAWANAVAPSLAPTVRGVPEGQPVSEAEVLAWISSDKATRPAEDLPYLRYASLHEMHNDGVSAENLDVARVALSKALNSTARWAPQIVNPVDVSGKGMVYRFDTRDYWGHNKGVTKLHFGGSDDDVFFGRTSVNYLGEPVDASITTQENYSYSATVSQDPSFAELVWDRVLAGNVEGATDAAVLPPNVDGFHAEYVEVGQLVYTLTRPDVYNAIMAIPWYADQLEAELGVIHDEGAKSYEWMVTFQAITVDSRLYYRADTTSGAYYWKTWDVFTGQLASGIQTIEQAYDQGQIRFPFWQHPIPKFISNFGFGGTENHSFIATLAQVSSSSPPAGCDGQPNYGDSSQLNCRWYTGTDGLQQSAEEVIWGLPNGMQAYALFGGLNQRRVDAFVNIVRDPRILRTDSDAQINSRVGFASADRRLNTGSSCIGCHADGMNRGNNDLRDWLDFAPDRLPHGARGVDAWIDDPDVVAQVKELYPPSSVMRPRMEEDRRRFLGAQAAIAGAMLLSEDKNVYVEPAIWTIEWARDFYQYPTTRSN